MRLTTLPHLCADCLEIPRVSQPPGTLRACPGLLWGFLYLALLKNSMRFHTGSLLLQQLNYYKMYAYGEDYRLFTGIHEFRVAETRDPNSSV